MSRAIKPRSANQRFVVLRGRVRTIETFDTATAAAASQKGEPCWIIVSEHIKAVPPEKFGRYVDVVRRAFRRNCGPGDQHYVWIDADGAEHFERWIHHHFETFEAAKAHLMKEAEGTLQQSIIDLKRDRARLREVRAMKAPKVKP